MSVVERELKFESSDSFVLPEVDGLVVMSDHSLSLDATYWDSADHGLLNRGITLRHRSASDGSEDGWTLEVGVDSPPSDQLTLSEVGSGEVARAELTASGSPDEPPPTLTTCVRLIVDPASLSPIARIETDRRVRQIGSGVLSPSVEVAEDVVRSEIAGTSGPSFRQVEVELLKAGGVDEFVALAEALADAGLRSSGFRSKLAQVLDIHSQVPLRKPAKANPDTPVAGFVHALIRATATQLVEGDLPVRIGEDPEAVHRARVATRRLRSDLRTLRPILVRSVVDPLRDELSWLGDLLGGVRDLDVLTARLSNSLRARDESHTRPALELMERLRDQRDFRSGLLLSAMSGDRYFRLIADLEHVADQPPFRDGVKKKASASSLMVRLARQPWKTVEASARKIGRHPSDEDLHRLRRDIKAARYTAEAARRTNPRSKRFASALIDVQDHLGELHDVIVTMDWLTENVDRFSPQTAYVAGILRAELEDRRHELRRTWRASWDRADRRSLRRWMA